MKKNEYIRTSWGQIGKITDIPKHKPYFDDGIILDNKDFLPCGRKFIKEEPSYKKIVDIVEYMDLLEIENPITTISGFKVSLFNPVRCDGFTTLEDGTHCIIINIDYLVDVNKLKIKSVLSKEYFDKHKYIVGDEQNGTEKDV